MDAAPPIPAFSKCLLSVFCALLSPKGSPNLLKEKELVTGSILSIHISSQGNATDKFKGISLSPFPRSRALEQTHHLLFKSLSSIPCGVSPVISDGFFVASINSIIAQAILDEPYNDRKSFLNAIPDTRLLKLMERVDQRIVTRNGRN